MRSKPPQAAVSTAKVFSVLFLAAALFAHPAAAQTIIAGESREITVSSDQAITSTRYQIGTRDNATANNPQNTLNDTALIFDIAQGATLTISGALTTNTSPYTGAGGAINVTVPGDAGASGNLGSALRFTGGGHLVFSGNEAQRYGGAVGSYFAGANQSSVLDFTGLASLTFDNNLVARNQTGFGGAVLAYASGASGQSKITMGDNVTFTSNIAGNGFYGYGGGIYSYAYGVGGSSSVTLGNNVNFTGNIAGRGSSSYNSSYGSGGGIYSIAVNGNSSVTLGNDVIFSGNIAGNGSVTYYGVYSLGGAIYSYSQYGNSLVTLGNNVTFTDNIAGVADYGAGGAIYSYSQYGNSLITLGNNVTFTDNIAGNGNYGYGGAIYSAGPSSSVSLGTNVLFRYNRAGSNSSISAYGGAIYSSTNVNLSGHTLFENNATTGTTANQAGGAIVLGGVAALNTGDDPGAAIAFRNNYLGVAVNTDGTWNTAGATANSIAMDSDAQLVLMGAGNIYFDDPISGGNVLVKSGDGFVQFAGANAMADNSTVDIQGGTFRVVEGAAFNAGGGAAFNVAGGGVLAGGGTITAGNGGFIISGTISPDSDRFNIPVFNYDTNTFASGRTEVADDKRIGALKLNGNVTLDGATINVDAVSQDSYDTIAVTGAVNFGQAANTVKVADGDANGNYNILTATVGIVLNGGSFNPIAGIGADGYAYVRGSSVHLADNDSRILQLTLDDTKNIALSWTGNGNSTWSASEGDRNWTDNPGGEANETRFKDGDTVTFDSAYATPSVITVDSGGVTIAEMIITGVGDWIFTGGTIGGDGGLTMNGAGRVTLGNFGFTGDIALNSGTLAIYADTLSNALTGSGILAVNVVSPGTIFTFANTVGTNFTGTVAMEYGSIDLYDNSTHAVLQNAGLALGTYGSTTISTPDMTIKSLTLDGGTVVFEEPVTNPNNALTVTDLVVANNGTIQMEFDHDFITGDPDLNWYDYADSTQAHQQLVIEATGSASGGQVAWVDENGDELDDAVTRYIHDVEGDIIVWATSNYVGSLNTSDTTKDLGLYLGYTLTELGSNDGYVIVLDSADAHSSTPSLQARLTGGGGFAFTGLSGQEVTVGHSSSDYAGPTTVENITLTFLTNNAFGNTSDLTIGTADGNEATVALNGYSQTVGLLTIYEGSTLDVDGGQMTIGDGSFKGSEVNGYIVGDENGLLIVNDDLTVNSDNEGLASNVEIADGATTLKYAGSLGASGLITLGGNSELIFDLTDDGILTKDVNGSGGVTKTGDGTLTMTLNGDGYSGLLTVEAGLLQLAGAGALGEIAVKVSGDGQGLEIQMAEGQARTIRDLTGGGDVYQSGSGLVVLDDEGELNALYVDNGIFILNDAHLTTVNGISVGQGGISTASFVGTGQVEGQMTVNSGSSLAPGAYGGGLGSLEVSGDLYFESGSFYVVEVNYYNTDEADLITVGGTAHLSGTVRHMSMAGQYESGGVNAWTILSAGELSGTFDGVETDFAFLNARLDYVGDTVQLVLYQTEPQNQVIDGLSRQQQWTQGGIQSLPDGSPVLDGYLNLPNNLAAIKEFLSMMSGEVHSSVSAALLTSERIFTNQMLAQTNRTFGGPAVSAGGDDRPFFWTALEAHHLSLKAGDGAHKLSGPGYGLTLGVETKNIEDWQLGAAMRLSRRELDVSSLNSEADIDSLGLGLYAARHWRTSPGLFGLAFGASHTWHDLETTRYIRTVTYNENVKGDYDARQWQLFAETSLTIETDGALTWRPHLGLLWNNLTTDGFRERGAAGLRVEEESDSVLSGIIGLGFSAALNERARLTADLAWQHSFGDIEYEKNLAFAGGDNFKMVGAPISRNEALVNLGLEAALTDSLNLNIGYSGQLGGDSQIHGGNATLIWNW